MTLQMGTIFGTLKFRIILLCVTASVLTALGTTLSVLSVTQAELQRQMLENERNDRVRTASLMASKLETLKDGLAAVSQSLPPGLWHDRAAMNTFLKERPVLSVLFDGVFAAAPDGTMLARVDKGEVALSLPNVGDREYFQRALQSDQPVVSEPVVGRATKKALAVVAISVSDAQGKRLGVLAGLLQLQSNSLFADPMAQHHDGVRDLVITRAGTLLWHTEMQRVMGNATDEQGLEAVFKRWHDSGSPIDTAATAELSGDYLVSMAGLPLSDWALVRLTPTSTLKAALKTAQGTATLLALTAGLLSALAAGVVASRVVRPIGVLRDRAERLLAGQDSTGEDWSAHGGEIGAMSQAFKSLLQARHQQHTELQAVLDNAEVGIALSRNSRFEMVSRQFCSIFGYERHQMAGQPTRMIYGSDADYETMSQRAGPAFMQHGMFDGEVELIRSNGQRFWARMRGRAVAPGDRSKGTIWVIADETNDHEHRERLSWAANHDRLTGLPNRAAFEALLEAATENATQAPFCALFIDLDRFKQVNDTGGHAAGDALLRELGQVLSAKLRKSDTVARLGGDEFAVLLPLCPIPRARVLAEALRASVEAYRLEWEGAQYAVGASIGLVAVNGTHASAADVLSAADKACYEAKRAGRNQVAFQDAAAPAAPQCEAETAES